MENTEFVLICYNYYIIIIIIIIEPSGAFGPGAREFFTELGRRLIRVTGDLMSRCHMIQQISVALQRGNTAAVLGTIEQCNVIDN